MAPAQSCGREVGREAGLGRRGSQAHPHENMEEMVALLAKQKLPKSVLEELGHV